MGRPVLAVGPELPEFGSWNWVGQDILSGLAPSWTTVAFSDVDHPPPADLTIYLKFKPTAERLKMLATQTRLIFAPVDVYGSVREIEDDRNSLRQFAAILVHAPRLSRYFTSMTATTYVDHSLRYISKEIITANAGRNLLWVGRRCNLKPVVDWVNDKQLDVPIHIVTEDVDAETTPAQLGFRHQGHVSISSWSPESHIQAMHDAMAALDIKANDFRARHKPPAKALDFLASGLPVIVNRGSSTDMHLQTLGYNPIYSDISSMTEPSFNTDGVRRIAIRLREQLSLEIVSRQIDTVLQSVVSETTVGNPRTQ